MTHEKCSVNDSSHQNVIIILGCTKACSGFLLCSYRKAKHSVRSANNMSVLRLWHIDNVHQQSDITVLFEFQALLANCNLGGQLTQFFFFFFSTLIDRGKNLWMPIIHLLSLISSIPPAPYPFILPLSILRWNSVDTFLKLIDQHSEHQLCRDFSSESGSSVNPTSCLFSS